MSELVSMGILAALALWGYGCWRVGKAFAAKIAREEIVPRKGSGRAPATRFIQMCFLLLLFAEARAVFGQTATSSIFPANPTFVDAVTSIVTVPAVAGQPPVTGMIGYTIDGGPIATATVTTGDNYLNLGQLSIGSHVLTFQAHPVTASPSPIVPPHPVSIPVTDQSFGFVGVYGYFNSVYTDDNFFSSAGIAIDSKDTVWIGDSILGKLASFDVFGNITNIPIANLPIPIAYPSGLAFDSSDNLFIADRGNSRIVKYTPTGVETVLPTPGLGRPGQLMLDKARNLLYVIDQDNERVVRYNLAAVTLAGYPFSGFTAIQSIALDPAGNVYVSDKAAGFLKSVNNVVSALPVSAPIETPGGIFIDRAGLLYLTDSSINGTYRVDAQGHQTQISDYDSSRGMAEDSHGRIYFGPNPNVRTFMPAGALGVAAASTSPFSNTDQVNSLVYTMPQGQTALNRVVSPSPTFVSDLGTEACPFVETFGTCYFRINFAPQVPGVSVGSIATTLPGGPTISTLIFGNAVGPAPALSPGTQTQTSSGASVSSAVALDQLGNYYVSDSSTNKVFETSSGVTHALGFSGLSKPGALAVDGLGAIDVLDSGNNRIAKLDAAGTQTVTVTAGSSNSLTAISSFATNGDGLIYFAGPAGGSNSIYLYDRTGTISLVASGVGTSVSLALDPYGDVYSLQADGSLIRIDINGKQSTLAAAKTFVIPTGLAVDPSETAYVAQSGNTAITLVHPGGGTDSIPVAGLDHAAGIAINLAGSILAVDSATNNFTFVDRTHQDYNFGDIPVNTTKTIVSFFSNAGTQPFNINQIPGDSNFMQVASADACVTSGTAANIAPASSCNLSYTVAPTALGAITAYSRVATDVSVDYDTFTENAVRVPTAPTLNPTSLSFGNVNVGAAATQTLTLTNNDTAPLTLGNISLSGSFSITGASTCKRNGAIAIGASCSLTVQFAPTVAGTDSSALVVQYTGGSVTASLTGTGAAVPIATLSPATLSFGFVTVGSTSSVQDATLTNTGTASFQIATITPSSSAIVIHTTNCARAVTPAGACKLEVTVAPTAAGAFTGSVIIDYYVGTGSDPSQNFSSTLIVTATGVASSVILTPASADFGSVAANLTSSSKVFTVTNAGTTAVSLSQVTIVGTFKITTGTTCISGMQLPGGQSCTISVAFAPVAAGASTGTLFLSYIAGAGPVTETSALTGTGIAAPLATLTPTSYNFGNVTVGATSSQLLLKFTNTGTTTLHPGNATATESGLQFPATAATTCTGSSGSTVVALSPGASCNLAIDFAPTTGGTQTGVVSIPSEAGNTSATITGTGVLPTATLAPKTYNFGSVTVGAKSSQLVLKLTNTSTVSLHTTGAIGSSPAFVLLRTATTCTDTTVLAPGGSCDLPADFSPTAVGTVTGMISIGSEAGTLTATFTGTGIAPTAALTPATYNFGHVTVGTTSSLALLQFTNTSTITLHPGNATGTVPGLGFPISAATTCTGSSGSTIVALSPGASCVLAIDFAPTTVGTQTGVVSIPSEAGNTTATITGTGVAPTPPPTVSPATLNFGNVTVGATSAAQTVIFTNPATFPLTLTNIGLVGSGFSIKPAGTTCKAGPSIAAGAACTLSIIFSPATAGAVSGSLTISLPPGLAVSSLAVPLTGTGVVNVVSPEVIDFTNGFNPNGMTLNGSATVSSGVLQLTANQPSQASAAFFPTPVSTTSFSTDFAFQLLDPLAEGITFTIQGDGPTAIGSNDGGLGYQGIAKSIALKFDLRDTAGEGVDSTGIYVDGAAPTLPATSLADSGIDLHSGDVFALHVSYDGTTESITLVDTATGAVWTTQAAENIPNIVGNSQAYFGFTASTGATTATSASIKPAATAATVSVGATANILYWAYANRSDGVAALEPIQLNFGNITVGSTSGVQSAELMNTGTASFQVSSITQSDPAIQVHTSFCARAVTPGNFCKIEVNLAPTAAAAFSGNVVINYFLGDGSSPSQNFTSTLKISGTGTVSSITLSPTSADFGSIFQTQTSSPKIFTLTNNNASTVSLTRITIGEDPTLPFQTASGATCIDGVQLPAGRSCTIPVVFAPKSTGASSGALYVSYLDGSNRAVTLTSLLTGTALATPMATLTPAKVDFGSVMFGVAVPPAEVQLMNTGTLPITVSAYTLTGSGFSVAGGSCVNTVPAGGSCTILIAFHPTVAGASSGNFGLTTNAGTKIVSLTGVGVAPPTPMATLTPLSYNFGDVPLGAPVQAEFELTNTSTLPVTVDDDSFTGSGYSIVGANASCLPAILAGNPCMFLLQFQPTVVGASSGSFILKTNAGSYTIALTGTGVAGYAPTLTLTPARVNFGNVSLGASPVQAVFSLINSGKVPITITNFTFTGSGFSLAGGQCANIVAADSTCMFTIAFQPTTVGASTGNFTLVTDAGTRTVELTGTGVTPMATLTAFPSSDFGNATLGQYANQADTINLTNTGAGTLSVGAYSVIGAGFLDNRGGNCPTYLAAGRSCIITGVLFVPSVAGPATGSVSVVTGAGTLVATLTGTGVAPAADTPFINFSTGFNADALMLTGPVNVAGGALQLTGGPSSAASSAFYPTSVPTASFTTAFTFQLLDPTAEGITFAIQNDRPDAVGGGGGGLGYQGILKSLALKFDLKDTAGEGTDSTGIYINGASPTVPAISLASAGIDLHSGHIFNLQLSYDGEMLSVLLTDTTTNANWTTKVAENIPGILDSNVAYFGFTAGSGTSALTSEVAASEQRSAIPSLTASSDAALAASKILTWIYVAGSKVGASQTISFPSLGAKTYGSIPITLDATVSSGLPVAYAVTGPAKLSGSMLTITGAGSVTVTATQPGNSTFAPASPVVQSFAVSKAPLTVTANSVSRPVGASNPTLVYNVSGLVNGDTTSSIGGTATLTTTAVPSSPAGTYPITFSSEGLTAANYTFNYVAGTLTVASSSCQTINYSTGFSGSGLALNGGAKINGNALELTDGGLSEARSAFFSTALPTTAFSTDFTFQITNPVADGMVFVIQSNNAHVLGEAGGGLGYAGIPHSVAIKVDLHNNAGEGTDSTGTYIDGAFPSVPAIDMTPSGINLHSGHIFAVHLAHSNALTVATIADTVTGVSASMNFPGDIAQVVGNNAWFGFTAGTGAKSATQQVLTWSYSGGAGCSTK